MTECVECPVINGVILSNSISISPHMNDVYPISNGME